MEVYILQCILIKSVIFWGTESIFSPKMKYPQPIALQVPIDSAPIWTGTFYILVVYV